MRFKCLILDHDDTAVNSTPFIHYPAHVEVMRRLRPGEAVMDLDTWFAKNFDPGIMKVLTDELGMNRAELDLELAIWREFTTAQSAPFFDGFLELLRRFRRQGGLLTVVSHSEKAQILRDYRVQPDPVEPDMVFGWENDESRRKPHPYPVERILEHFKLQPREALIIDDLKPALDMARATGVPIAGAGWGHDVPVIREYMQQHCDVYFRRIEDLAAYLEL